MYLYQRDTVVEEINGALVSPASFVNDPCLDLSLSVT